MLNACRIRSLTTSVTNTVLNTFCTSHT
jgi:hypothetical protein